MKRAVAACALVLALAFAVPFHALAARSQTTGNSGQVGSTPVTAAPFAMAIWFRSATATTAEQSLFSIQNSGTPSNFFLLDGRGDTAGNTLQAYAADPAANPATTTTALQDNTWHHCLGDFAPTSRSVFLDGAGRGDNVVTTTPTGLNRISIGTAGAQGIDVNGTMAYAAIWSCNLEVAGIVSLAAGQNPITGPHADQLVFFAPLDGSGSIEADVVGGRALTVGNGVVAETKPGMLLR